MKRFVLLICLMLSALVVSCGGGSGGSSSPASVPVKQVAFLGDSLTNGGLYNGQSLQVRPVVRMTEYANGRWMGVNLAVDGMKCVDNPGSPAHITTHVFRFGMADHVLGTTPSALQTCLYQSAMRYRLLGHTVYMVGVINNPDPVKNAQLALMNQAVIDAAAASGSIFIDARSVGLVEMADDIHPNQAGSDVVSRYIADRIQ